MEASLPPVVPQRVKPVPPELVEGQTQYSTKTAVFAMAQEPVAPPPRRLSELGATYCARQAPQNQHALEGFNGPQVHATERGIAHSDAEVKAGVDYGGRVA